jgi:hypothetical protein
VPAGNRRQDRSAIDDESKSAHGRQVDKQCGWKAGAMRRGTLKRLGSLSPSLCTPIVWAVPPLSRMRFATPNGVSLTGASPPRRCSAQESEGEESKTGEQISVDSDRPSHGRVRFAALTPRALDPGPFRRWTKIRESGQLLSGHARLPLVGPQPPQRGTFLKRLDTAVNLLLRQP